MKTINKIQNRFDGGLEGVELKHTLAEIVEAMQQCSIDIAGDYYTKEEALMELLEYDLEDLQGIIDDLRSQGYLEKR